MVLPRPREVLQGGWFLTFRVIHGGAGRRCHSHLTGNPTLREHVICDISFAFPTEPRISTNSPSTAASEPFSQIQPNAKPESPLFKAQQNLGILQFLAQSRYVLPCNVWLNLLVEKITYYEHQ